jgi:hypothetical protein
MHAAFPSQQMLITIMAFSELCDKWRSEMASIPIRNFVNSSLQETHVKQRRRLFQALFEMDDLCSTTSGLRRLLSLTMRLSITHKIRHLHHYWFCSMERRVTIFSVFSVQLKTVSSSLVSTTFAQPQYICVHIHNRGGQFCLIFYGNQMYIME